MATIVQCLIFRSLQWCILWCLLLSIKRLHHSCPKKNAWTSKKAQIPTTPTASYVMHDITECLNLSSKTKNPLLLTDLWHKIVLRENIVSDAGLNHLFYSALALIWQLQVEVVTKILSRSGLSNVKQHHSAHNSNLMASVCRAAHKQSLCIYISRHVKPSTKWRIPSCYVDVTDTSVWCASYENFHEMQCQLKVVLSRGKKKLLPKLPIFSSENVSEQKCVGWVCNDFCAIL